MNWNWLTHLGDGNEPPFSLKVPGEQRRKGLGLMCVCVLDRNKQQHTVNTHYVVCVASVSLAFGSDVGGGQPSQRPQLLWHRLAFGLARPIQ